MSAIEFVRRKIQVIPLLGCPRKKIKGGSRKIRGILLCRCYRKSQILTNWCSSIPPPPALPVILSGLLRCSPINDTLKFLRCSPDAPPVLLAWMLIEWISSRCFSLLLPPFLRMLHTRFYPPRRETHIFRNCPACL